MKDLPSPQIQTDHLWCLALHYPLAIFFTFNQQFLSVLKIYTWPGKDLHANIHTKDKW